MGFISSARKYEESDDRKHHHHRQQSVLSSNGNLGFVNRYRAVMSQNHASDVAGYDCHDLDEPHLVRRNDVQVYRPISSPEKVPAQTNRIGHQRKSLLTLD